MALVTVSSARWRRTRTPRSSRVNQATCSPASTACWPRASSRNVLPVPAGPHTTRFSRRCTHSRVRSACWVGAGIEDSVGVPGVEGLAGGEPGRGPGGWPARTGPAGDLLGEQRFEHLGGIPALRFGGGQHLGGGAADMRAAASAAAAAPARGPAAGRGCGLGLAAVMAGPDHRRAVRRCVRRSVLEHPGGGLTGGVPGEVPVVVGGGGGAGVGEPVAADIAAGRPVELP